MQQDSPDRTAGPRARSASDNLAAFKSGLVIPAHPLALTDAGMIDERRQAALTRYYCAAGAGGLAVGVHTTEFEIRQRSGMFRETLRLAAIVARESREPTPLLVSGACGEVRDAVREAEVAAELGYDYVLLSPGDLAHLSEAELLDRTREVARVLPVIGFYLQPAVHGRHLSKAYWTRLADIENVVGVKAAPFDRYATLEVIDGVAKSGRADEVTIYTGNDDNIVADLLTPFPAASGEGVTVIAGGLLGQWAVWTLNAVRLLERVKAVVSVDRQGAIDLLREGAILTRANQAIFDRDNNFRGCVPGIKEILRRQGLLANRRCLDPNLDLSPGQSDAISHAVRAYPELADDGFVQAHIDEWLA